MGSALPAIELTRLGLASYGVGPSSYGISPAGCGLGPASYGIGPVGCGVGLAGCGVGPASYMVGWWPAHVIIVSPQSQLDLNFDLGVLWGWVWV